MSLKSQFRRERKAPMAEMNVVPYIDVMLVLLVIFMITAPMLTQGIEVDLPQADADALSLKDQQPLIVTCNPTLTLAMPSLQRAFQPKFAR